MKHFENVFIFKTKAIHLFNISQDLRFTLMQNGLKGRKANHDAWLWQRLGLKPCRNCEAANDNARLRFSIFKPNHRVFFSARSYLRVVDKSRESKGCIPTLFSDARAVDWCCAQLLCNVSCVRWTALAAAMSRQRLCLFFIASDAGTGAGRHGKWCVLPLSPAVSMLE